MERDKLQPELGSYCLASTLTKTLNSKPAKFKANHSMMPLVQLVMKDIGWSFKSSNVLCDKAKDQGSRRMSGSIILAGKSSAEIRH